MPVGIAKYQIQAIPFSFSNSIEWLQRPLDFDVISLSVGAFRQKWISVFQKVLLIDRPLCLSHQCMQLSGRSHSFENIT